MTPEEVEEIATEYVTYRDISSETFRTIDKDCLLNFLRICNRLFYGNEILESIRDGDLMVCWDHDNENLALIPFRFKKSKNRMRGSNLKTKPDYVPEPLISEPERSLRGTPEKK